MTARPADVAAWVLWLTLVGCTATIVVSCTIVVARWVLS